MQGRVQQAFFHLKVAPTTLLEQLDDLVTVHRPFFQQAEDQDLGAAFAHLVSRRHGHHT
jgi:hypothetical protein